MAQLPLGITGRQGDSAAASQEPGGFSQVAHAGSPRCVMPPGNIQHAFRKTRLELMDGDVVHDASLR